MPAPRWKFPTLDDHRPDLAPLTVVQCACRRKIPADMMVDVRPLKLTKEEVASLRLQEAPDFLCDSCRTHLLRKGTFRREDLARMHGAPADVQNRMKTQDEAEHPELRGNPNAFPHRK